MCHRGKKTLPKMYKRTKKVREDVSQRKKSLPKMYKRSEKVREDEPYMKIIFV